MNFNQFSEKLSIKLTPLRRLILLIMWKSDKPLKAYDILNRLSKTKENAKPPTVYRVLDFLAKHEIIHKIQSINSYVICQHPHQSVEAELLMVCDQCHLVTEVVDQDMHTLLAKITVNNHFIASHDVIEIAGLCDRCR